MTEAEMLVEVAPICGGLDLLVRLVHYAAVRRDRSCPWLTGMPDLLLVGSQAMCWREVKAASTPLTAPRPLARRPGIRRRRRRHLAGTRSARRLGARRDLRPEWHHRAAEAVDTRGRHPRGRRPPLRPVRRMTSAFTCNRRGRRAFSLQKVPLNWVNGACRGFLSVAGRRHFSRAGFSAQDVDTGE
jgi:hypothetical protein